ncbi:hypothetical protein JCM8547_002751 [Rhodosporidiobolus lusitaniae]
MSSLLIRKQDFNSNQTATKNLLVILHFKDEEGDEKGSIVHQRLLAEVRHNEMYRINSSLSDSHARGPVFFAVSMICQDYAISPKMHGIA